MAETSPERLARPVSIPVGDVTLDADLTLPPGAEAVVVFAHGTGSGRHSPRNRLVASVLSEAGLGTLLMDLLTPGEEQRDLATAELRFDIGLLGERTVGAIDWLAREPTTAALRVGAFGASTGAAAALIAAAERPEAVRAVVSRGGRPDLAAGDLRRVRAPTLLIVGGEDTPVIGMNREAMRELPGEVELEIVPGATHLFEEPGALERVAALARDWLLRHLSADA
ncbi:MAG TPA: alpha/beta fold hydrolase [Thermoleophilaceae bacterium]|nr:alpha/beta fold hydrolase [Thermoleophilaceae bacterium]